MTPMLDQKYNVCGLGNAIVDLFLDVSDAEFAELAFERGTMRLVEPAEQAGLIERVHKQNSKMAAGGSVANSMIALTQLGGQAAFIGCLGDDLFGNFYAEEFKQLGVDLPNPPLPGEATGTSVCLVTPDAERTMRTSLAVSKELACRHVSEAALRDSDWLFVEGYVFANPDSGQAAVRRAIDLAKVHGVKVALTCSDAFIPEVFGEAFGTALDEADLLFANAAEAMAITGERDAAHAFAALKRRLANVVVTDGPHGAHVHFDNQDAHVPAVKCEPVDLTGAGDMFAGAFLYGVTHGVKPADAARGANALCAKVITQLGARLTGGAREAWDAAVRG